jgi:hypothetical protein
MSDVAEVMFLPDGDTSRSYFSSARHSLAF